MKTAPTRGSATEGTAETQRVRSKARARERTRNRILIGDPDPLARRVIRDALQAAGDFVVPAEASTAIEVVELCRYYRPDVAMLEIDLPDASGIATTWQITEQVPEVRVLILSREEAEDTQLEALTAGASGFVPKSAEISRIVDAARSVARDEAVIPPKTTMRLIERLRALPEGGLGMRPVRSALTPREWEVLDLMSQDLDTHEMSEALVLTEETIYSHVKNVLRKLSVHSRREAVEVARAMRDPAAALLAEATSGKFGVNRAGTTSSRGRDTSDPPD
jgi:two-component system, NarL family, response regulator LiaR